jgi:hypothetical protein
MWPARLSVSCLEAPGAAIAPAGASRRCLYIRAALWGAMAAAQCVLAAPRLLPPPAANTAAGPATWRAAWPAGWPAAWLHAMHAAWPAA